MDEMQKGGNTTMMVDVGMFLLILVVGLMAISPATRGLAIGVGIAIPWGIGLVMVLVGFVDFLMKHMSSNGDQDFSSLPASEERAFIGHERLMRSNSARANLIGFGIAGAMFVLGLIVTMGLYTPCTSFCEHAPSSCSTDAAKASWQATCESSCGRLESTGGLSVLKPTGEDRKGLAAQPVSGTEYVQALNACNFSNGVGPVCEGVVKKATELGLWCPEKN